MQQSIETGGVTVEDDSTRALMLSAEGITHSYGAVHALNDVSLDVRKGEIHALCGQNGAGKSTLIKIITGAVVPDQGRVRLEGEEVDFRSPRDAQLAGIALVDQELSIIPELSVEDNLLLGRTDIGLLHRPGRVEVELRRILDQVGLSHIKTNQRVADLAIGERQLIEIARALSRSAKLLLLDEPTATLTDAEIDRVFDAVRNIAAEGRSVIFVSHRLDEVRRLCDRVTVLRDGKRIGTESIENTDVRKVIQMMLGSELRSDRSRRDRSVERSGSGLKVRSLSIGHRVADVSFDVSPGEVVGLAGQVGSGTVDVLRALAGIRPDAHGQVQLNDVPLSLGNVRRSIRRGIVYVSHDRKGEGLFLSRPVEENLVSMRLDSCSRFGIINFRAFRAIARNLADTVGVPAVRMKALAVMLSGGNQQKVLIGRYLERPETRVLLLDEPTRGVDVAGRAEIHQLVREAADKGVSVVFSSTELDEIIDLSDRVLTMRSGRVIANREGSELTTSILLSDMTHEEAGD